MFLDLSKAFDTIDPNILLRKMERYGIRGLALKWFKSYLSDRFQYVSCKNNSSEKLPVRCGVPHGLVLGPLLFLYSSIFYVNDLEKSMTYMKPIMFADGTTAHAVSSPLPDLLTNVNIDLNSLSTWLRTNKLSLNVSKSKYMTFSTKELGPMCDIEIEGSKIERVDYHKFLGIIIDRKLKWHEYIMSCRAKMSSTLYALNSSKTCLTEQCSLMICNSLVPPILSYGILLWGSAGKILLNRPWVMPKKAARIITKSQYNASKDPLFSHLNIMELNDLYNFHMR